eukprot:m.124580 g.124580  ORF g.124580 m.124580 type:complete len:1397 (+) comp9425_c11_seq7:26-4216(+)
MGRNPVALFVRGRTDPYLKKKKDKYQHHKRKHADTVNEEDQVEETEHAKLAHMEQLLTDATTIPQESSGPIASQTRKEFDDDDNNEPTMGEDGNIDDDEEEEEYVGDIHGSGMDISEVEDKRNAVGPSALRSVKELFAIPTREELQQLAESSYQADLFTGQMDEMLTTVVPPSRIPEHVIQCVEEVKGALQSLKKKKVFVKTMAEAELLGIKVPISCPFDSDSIDEKDAFIMEAPEEVTQVGSFASGTHCRPNLCIDLVVEMPQAFRKSGKGNFRHGDRKKFVFFHKRAYYLAYVVAALNKLSSVESVHFEHFMGDPFHPIVVLTPKHATGKKIKKHTSYSISIHAVAPHDVFKLNSLKPSQDGLCWSDLASIHKTEGKYLDSIVSEKVPTPRYNQRLLLSKFMTQHSLFLHKTFNVKKELKERIAKTIMLLKTWLRQRHMTSKHFGAFNGFVGTMLLAHLLRRRKSGILKESSPFEMFKKLMSVIATSEWDKVPLIMRQEIETDVEPPTADMFNSNFLVSFIGPSGHCNLLAHMTQGQYEDLKYEAQRALVLLKSDDSDSFSHLFLKDHALVSKFDYTVHVRITPQIAQRYGAKLLDRGGDWIEFSHRLVPEILRRGVGDRAIYVTCIREPCAPIDPFEKVTSFFDKDHCILSIGMVAHPNNYMRERDIMLPGASDTEVARFCNIWGSKAVELAMSDASIRFGVVWQCAATERHLILKWIALHLLHLHLKIESDDVTFQTYLFEPSLVPISESTKQQELEVDDALLREKSLANAFEALSDAISSIELPLYVKDISCVSSAYRCTDPFPPTPIATQQIKAQKLAAALKVNRRDRKKGSNDSTSVHHTTATETFGADVMTPQEVVLQLEASNKWPDDISAIQEVKTAFLLNIARELRGVDVGLEKEVKDDSDNLATALGMMADSDSEESEEEDAEEGGEEGEGEGDFGVMKSGSVQKQKKKKRKKTVDGVIRCRMTRGFLDVVVRGYLFRIVLYVERELQLLQRQAQNLFEAAQQGTLSPEDEDKKMQVDRFCTLMTRDFVKLPQLTSLIRDFSVQYRSFSQTARLAKRWLHAHMFSSHIEDEFVDLLVLSLFNKSLPYLPPMSPDVGFLRFLQLLASHNWLHDPLFVDPLDDITDEEKLKIRESFRLNRASYPVMFLATKLDDKSLWSLQLPSKQLFLRLVSYAKAATKAVMNSMQSVTSFIGDEKLTPPNVLSVFQTPKEGFNLSLKLKPSVNFKATYSVEEKIRTYTEEETHDGEGIDGESSHESTSADSGKKKKTQFKNFMVDEQLKSNKQKKQQEKKKAYTSHPPIDLVNMYFSEIKAKYTNQAIFFHDDLGGDTIYVSLSPMVLAEREFKKTDCTNTVVNEKGQISFNVEEFAAELLILGEGIVESITLHQ